MVCWGGCFPGPQGAGLQGGAEPLAEAGSGMTGHAQLSCIAPAQ